MVVTSGRSVVTLAVTVVAVRVISNINAILYDHCEMKSSLDPALIINLTQSKGTGKAVKCNPAYLLIVVFSRPHCNRVQCVCQ